MDNIPLPNFSEDDLTLIMLALFEYKEKIEKNGGLVEDIETYQRLFVVFKTYRNSRFPREEWLGALTNTGPKKPIGYYHALEIEDEGYSFEDIDRMAKERGLKTEKFSKGFSGESIYFYNKDVLNHFLQSNEQILTEAHWPLEPEAFVDKVSQEAVEPGTPLFNVIAEAFGDEKNKRVITKI